MSLLVVGSIALDTVVTPLKTAKDVLGGSCTYFSYAASFFDEVQVVAVVGDDFPKEYYNLLRGRNIDLRGLQVVKGGKTFRWAGTYEENMNTRQTDDLQFGVLAGFDPDLPEDYRDTEYLFLGNAHPQIQLKVLGQMRGNPFVVCDTIDHYIKTCADQVAQVMAKSNGVILNDGEAMLLTGARDAVTAANKMLMLGLDFAIVKKGEHGALLATEGNTYPIPAFPLREVKDPTGAGDAFAGGFMGYVARSEDSSVESLRRAMAFGTVAASFACEDFSLDGLTMIDEDILRERLRLFRDLIKIP